MALYRKYRPATFAEVVGQEQVTRPLSAALDAGRINHAYLFSGPRGCGKTSSARIMARSLNCVQGPTSTPCGVCDSCVSLAPGGTGNLDVTELDAASHNGVDDMRELRDRAYYAPADSRYRIFIIDEAPMISASGANALLKVVEEPPEHVIFIFATTEPEKIIGTIRSRTHHYPFRLLTPPAMRGLLERTVAAEGVQVEDSVYPLVIAAGGGSPRDSLSILDQLLAGAGPDGLTYDIARPLLGVTDESIIDDVIAALAAGDKPGLFSLIDAAVEAGHDPQRFARDLLDRLRDLMILQAVPSAFEEGLVSAPAVRAEILQKQAAQFSGDHLTYLASTVNKEIPQLRGATSPRLLLEIMAARLVMAPTAAATPVPAATPAPSGAEAGAAVLAARRARAQAKQQEQTPPAAQPTPAVPKEPDALQQLREQWARLRELVGQRNKVAEIMLAEARVLGLRGDTVVVGHTTGALAQRINAPENNRDIVAVLNEHVRPGLAVECVVGTDPQAAGLPAAPAAPRAWNPNQHAREPQADEQEPERPAPAPPTNTGWGAPAPIGRDVDAVTTPEPEPEPKPVEARPAIWRERIAQASDQAEEAAAHSFSDGVPLPPEPEVEAGPPEEAASASWNERAEEDRMIAEAAQTEGEQDRRTAIEVAMDLLQQELGARRL